MSYQLQRTGSGTDAVCQRSDATVACAGKAALVKSVQELYGASNLADINLIVGGRTFEVHRHVLAPHSPVFRRMWHHHMSEVSLSGISIPSSSELLADHPDLAFVHFLPLHHVPLAP